MKPAGTVTASGVSNQEEFSQWSSVGAIASPWSVRSLLTEEEGANTMVEVVLIIVVAAVFAGVLWKAFFSSNGARHDRRDKHHPDLHQLLQELP